MQLVQNVLSSYYFIAICYFPILYDYTLINWEMNLLLLLLLLLKSVVLDLADFTKQQTLGFG